MKTAISGSSADSEGPELGGLGASGGLLLRGEGGEEGGEEIVFEACRTGKEVPAPGLHRIFRDADSGCEEAAETRLADRVSGISGAAEPGRSGDLVALAADAIANPDAVLDLGIDEAALGGAEQPSVGNLLAEEDALTFEIHMGEGISRLGASGFGGAAEIVDRDGYIALQRLALDHQEAEIVESGRLVLF